MPSAAFIEGLYDGQRGVFDDSRAGEWEYERAYALAQAGVYSR